MKVYAIKSGANYMWRQWGGSVAEGRLLIRVYRSASPLQASF